jgi:subtilisin family serine protease
MAARTRRVACALALFLSLLALVSPAGQTPARAQSPAPALSGAPAVIEATVPLGAIAQTSLTLRNDGAVAVTPRLFEALQPSAQPTALARPSSARVPLPQGGPRVDPQISADLAADAGDQATFIIFLADQADLSAAYSISNWAARGEYVVRTLRGHAEATQRDLRSLLVARGMDFTPLWIVNALVARGDSQDVAALARRAEVAELRANHVAELDAPAPAPIVQQGNLNCAPDADNVCWNIARVGASRAWANFGVRGAGITVASIDSGVRFDHAALLGQYRGNRGGTIDHNYNWFDVYGDSASPVDSGNHGTHTMGTMVAAGNGAAQPAVGVAPGASWMAVRACGTTECSEVDLILAAEWLLAPTDLQGGNPRPDLRPNIINNSWTAGKNASWYAGYTAAWRAAGIYPVFAAGNTGNLLGCGTVLSPGEYADVTAVGALDNGNRVASYSSVGPGPNGRVKPDLTAPGSGIWSTVSDPSRVYGVNSGTSMATPHVAGAVALLWSASPALIGDYEATYAALTDSAAPITGDARYMDAAHTACQPIGVPNNIYGYGRLDVYSAVARVTIDVPWLVLPAQGASLAPSEAASLSLSLDARRVPGPGTYRARVLVHGADLAEPPLLVPVVLTVPSDLQHAVVSGQVTRAADGAPIKATVRVFGGAELQTDEQGRYSLTLPPATAPYTLTATARDYVAEPGTVLLAPGEQRTLNFSLATDVPRLQAELSSQQATVDFAQQVQLSFPLANTGTKTLSYTVSLPNDRYGVWRSDEADGPQALWTEPPEAAQSIPLADDGASEGIPIGFAFSFAGATYDKVYVSANGVISFSPLPTKDLSFARGCLPLSETAGPAIAPLRVDLDPSQEGARVSYASLPEGFLLTWENVPLYNDSAIRLSFQTLLIPDGRVSMRYRTIAGLTDGESASYGLQYALDEVQTLGCKADLRLADGLTVELRPQVPAEVWLQVQQPRGEIAPGESRPLELTLRWVHPVASGWPLSGAVLLQTNDPTQREVRLTVRAQPTQAPYNLHFPHVPQGEE